MRIITSHRVLIENATNKKIIVTLIIPMEVEEIHYLTYREKNKII